MQPQSHEQNVFQFVNEIGYDIEEDMVQNIEVQYQKIFDFLPELAIIIASYVVKKTFTYQSTSSKLIKDGFCFLFANMFDDERQINGKRRGKTQEEMAYVQVFPTTLSHKSIFKKNAHVRAVSMIVSGDYLESFLRQDAKKFAFLFDKDNDFLIEEIMTDDILRTVNDIVNKEGPVTLNDYHYKLKATELLFYFFQGLNKREKLTYQNLSEGEIKSIYRVRDKIISSLHKPSTNEELKQIAGMSELKMRKLFTQVFGMGIYDYFQHFRMKEAARLLQNGKLSVSEVGYRMGFENLSHFTRVFEKHIGKKPKKFSVGI